MDLKEFLKKYSTISNYFLDEFLGFYKLETLNTDFIIDLNKIAIWLDTKKGKLKETLIKSYRKGIDYVIHKAKKEPNSGSGGATKENIYLTAEAFKKLCMLSRTKKGEEVRNYFLELENLINRYKNYIIHELNSRIKTLENNQKPIVDTKKGTIYVIRATDNENDSLYKIGKTENLKKRAKQYNTGRADNIEILFHYEVNDIHTVEKCIKLQMKKHQYRKYKEVYQINIDILKQVIKKCDEFEVIFKKENITNNQLAGNLYVIFDEDNNVIDV